MMHVKFSEMFVFSDPFYSNLTFFQNFLNLGQLPSNLYQGDPFIPKRIIPVDLFPHTPHYELVMFFERFPLMKLVADKKE